jgi:hypothetical protein
MAGKLLGVIWVALAVVVLAGIGAVGQAADFRVENAVFVGEPKEGEEPASRSSTIFHRGVVYDFLDDPAEVTIYDPAGARFILLDVEQKLRTDLSPDDVRKAMDRLKYLAKKSNDRKMQFLCEPTFEESIDPATGELVFDSDLMDYRVKGARTDSPEMVRQYHEFSDWYARLNAYLRPGSRPPFARMIVNAALAKRGEVPDRIVLTLRERRGLTVHKEQLRSEHHLVKRLVGGDFHRVAEAGQQMAAFKTVSFREYEASRRASEEQKAKDAEASK